MADTDIILSRQGFLARITLNRPSALNALDHGMIEMIDRALLDWEKDTSVACVLVDGAGPKGLCAGGDIRAMRQTVLDGAPERSDRYLADEYRMNLRIDAFPKPFVALMDGIVMGGGVGVSAHGSHRIVTERTRLAMPEVAIGFLPDVGGTWLLSRAPGELGTHAGLTGGPLSAFDAIACGFADTHVPSDRLDALREGLQGCGDAEATTRLVAGFATDPARTGFATAPDWIDRCYQGDDPQAIVLALRAHGDAAASEAADRIDAVCPMAVAVTLRALRRAALCADLASCLRMERHLGARLLRRTDFAEGVRAVVVDKDRTPRWSPPTLAGIDGEELNAMFADL